MKKIDELLELNNFGVSEEEFIDAIITEITAGEYKVIRDGFFWESDQEYAYSNPDRWDKKIDEKSTCEVCGTGYYDYNRMQGREDYRKALLRHHHDGYAGENAFKTHIVCRKCHGYCHRKENIKLDFEEVQKKYKNNL